MTRRENVEALSTELRKLNTMDTETFQKDLGTMYDITSKLAEEASDEYYVAYVCKDILADLNQLYTLTNRLREAKLDLYEYIHTGPFYIDEEEEK